METELKDSNLEICRLYDFFSQSPISIELYDIEGTLLKVNQACIDLFGIKNKNDLFEISLYRKTKLTEQQRVDILAGKTIRCELVYDFGLIRSTKLYETTREDICYLDCCIYPIVNQDKEICGFVVHNTEITERKNIEISHTRKTRDLQAINASKDKFISIIAHDLKGPFNAIMGFTDLMLNNFDQLDQETFIKGLKTIESASSHAYKLLENLLIWSQNQTGKKKFNPENLNLKSQIRESLKKVESAAVVKKIKISTTVNKEFNVFADKDMFDSIIRNLVSNAIKYSFKGGKIRIAATLLESEIHISVTDNGIGISHDKLPLIFDIDKRTSTIGTEDELGTGLGLILCKDFLIRHKGKIWIESTPDVGTLVSFSLPLN